MESAPNDYAWDVFVSYARGGPVEKFVRKHLVPELEDWLQEELKRKKVFLDANIPTGGAWPPALKESHLTSRVLLCVFSSQYFESEWCQTELHSMLERHRDRFDTPQRFIHVIVAHNCVDDRNLKPDVRALQRRSFHSFTHMQDKRTVKFTRAVEQLATEIANSVRTVPPWRPDFPVLQEPAREKALSLRPLL